MKHLKSFNEHYDDADIRSRFEVPELTGELDFKELSSDSNILKTMDSDKYSQTLSKLVLEIPLLSKFDASKSDDNLTLFKKFEKSYDKDGKTIAALVIIIDVNDDDSYVLKMESKVFGYLEGEESVLYEDSFSHQLMNDMNTLVGIFRSTVLHKVKKWSDNVKRYIGEEFMQQEAEQHSINVRHN